MAKLSVLILAGGVGTRLWPLSRTRAPKQHLPLFGRLTLLQKTYARAKKILPDKRIFIGTHESEVPSVLRQLPRVRRAQIVVESEQRGTGAAIGLGAIHMMIRDPNGIMATLNADAYVQEEGRLMRALRAAVRAVERSPNHLVLLGVPPTYPETGYGYIIAGLSHGSSGRFPLFTVDRFCEKPSRSLAARFIKKGNAYWNPTILVARTRHILTLYQQLLPETYAILTKIQDALHRGGTQQSTARLFRQINASDINYDILERAQHMLLLRVAGVGWADIGHWKSVEDLFAANRRGLIQSGPQVGLDASDNFIVGDPAKLVALIGVHHLVIVETPDALLVCDRRRVQDVKRLTRAIQARGLTRYL